MARVAVRCRDLSRSFGEVSAVSRLTFDIEAGELFGIVGPDGAGKTTTLRMLAGVLPPSEGDALLEGVSVAERPEAVKHHIAYMSQRFGLYGDLTVRENIEFYADLYQVPRAERGPRLERLYGFSGLGPFERRLAGHLSGGMKQKLGLCCALIHQPEILLLDEPTFGVDPISRRDLWIIIHEMVGAGMTVVISTAYLDEAERCDRVAFFDHGRILALDTPRALQGMTGRTIHVVRADRPRLAREVLRTEPGVTSAALFGDAVHIWFRDPASDWPAARAALEAAGVRVIEEAAQQPSLEDVFIELAQRGDGDE